MLLLHVLLLHVLLLQVLMLCCTRRHLLRSRWLLCRRSESDDVDALLSHLQAYQALMTVT
jgi:hypothetical protein